MGNNWALDRLQANPNRNANVGTAGTPAWVVEAQRHGRGSPCNHGSSLMKSTLSRIVSIVAALCLFSVATALQAQNPSNPLDVNGDTSISPFDAVTVFNDLITNGSHSTPPSFHDVNGDGFVTPIDSLRPINYLNANGITPAFPGGGGPVNITVPCMQPISAWSLPTPAARRSPACRSGRSFNWKYSRRTLVPLRTACLPRIPT